MRREATGRRLLHAWSRIALALVVATTTLLAAGGGTPASAAAPQLLGQTGAPGVGGSCGHCSVVQFANAGLPSSTYVVPSRGVLTKFQVYVGGAINAGDWVQLRTFRTSGAPNATVISEGAQHSLVGSAPGSARTFFDRVPATAGDVLGGRYHIANTADATPVEFPTASASDVAGVLFLPSDPAVGGSFVVTPATQYRANMLATLESDADGDGYGDTSQDLCPGDGAAAVTACSGMLLASRLQGAHTTSGGSCGYACLRVQKTVAGISTAAPVDGVVVRWRLLAAPAGSYRIRVVAPAGGATYTVLRSSAAATVTADPSPLKEAISTFETRLPIPAGGYVGLAPPPFASQRFLSFAPGSTYGQLNDGADGTDIPETLSAAGEGSTTPTSSPMSTTTATATSRRTPVRATVRRREHVRRRSRVAGRRQFSIQS